MPARLVPPDEPPKSQLADDESAWMTIVSTQLADTRKSAENWRTGLVGLLGLVSIFSAVQGPSSVNSLPMWAAVSAGILLFLSLLSAAAGTVASLQAAYGHPAVLSRARFSQLGGSAGFQFEEARSVIAQLRIAQILAFMSLAFVVAAIGLSWYSPRASADTVKIVMRSGENLCGQLASSANGSIQIDSPSLGAVMIKAGNVEILQPVKAC